MAYPSYIPKKDDETYEERKQREEYNDQVDAYIEEGRGDPSHWTNWEPGWEPPGH